MATKKTPLTEDDNLMPVGNDTELDQAIDDLRGVLKADAGSVESDFGAEFGATATSDLADSSSDFGGMPGGGSGTFGAGFDATGDFGGSAYSDSAFGGEEMKEPGSALNANIDLIMDIPIDVEIVLGTSRMQVSGLMSLEEGATIALDKRIGEPVEIMVNGRRIGKGEITVLENDDTRFGVKLTEVLSAKRT
jgi:flagellar motor switch protein FliN